MNGSNINVSSVVMVSWLCVMRVCVCFVGSMCDSVVSVSRLN